MVNMYIERREPRTYDDGRSPSVVVMDLCVNSFWRIFSEKMTLARHILNLEKARWRPSNIVS